jgi:hypothetical protein
VPTVTLTLQDTHGHPRQVEARVRLDTVELFCEGRMVGVCLRDNLASWLEQPHDEWVYDDVAWLRSTKTYTLEIRDLMPRVRLSPRDLVELYAAVIPTAGTPS